jgi:hypothetical protein
MIVLVSSDDTVTVTSDNVTGDSVYNYELEADPSDCIGLLQKPGCGKKPEDAGERGGSLQYLTFAIILVGLAVIFTVVFRNVLRTDKAKAASAGDPDTKWQKTPDSP